MTHAKPLPSELSVAPFDAAAARARGISTSRLRASDLRTPHRGVRVATIAGVDFSDRIAAYAIHMAADEYFSHTTAAMLYGIPLPRPIEAAARIHISVPFPAHPPQVRGVIGHRLSVPIAARSRKGFRIVSPARTWTQLAALLDYDDLVIAGDYLVQRKRPLCTLEQLAAAVASMGPARGALAARAALCDIRSGTDSPMETVTRLLIVRADLPEPVIGFTVTDRNGDYVGTPDLAYVAERIAIEYQGTVHRTDEKVFADDIERRILFDKAGWQVILVIKDHVYRNPHWILRRIREALRDRANLPPVV